MIPDQNIVDKIRTRLQRRYSGRALTRNLNHLELILVARPHQIPRYHISINSFIRRTFP